MSAHCDIWMSGLAAEATADLALLNPVEHDRRAGYHFAADRSRFTLGVALSRRAAGRMLGVSPAQVRLDRICAHCGAPHGKPTLPGTGLYLSVSHSADLVVVALTAAGPVGVDVELIDASRRPGTAHADSNEDFFRTWCRTEAVVKATGDGARVPFDEVTVSAPGDPPRLVGYPGTLPVVQLADLELRGGYAAAVAVLGDEPISVEVRRSF